MGNRNRTFWRNRNQSTPYAAATDSNVPSPRSRRAKDNPGNAARNNMPS